MELNERRIHEFFRISVIIKGIDALVELVSGIVLFFVSTDSILHLVRVLTQQELRLDPRDFIATHLLAAAQQFSVGQQAFYAFYLVSHGVIKLLLVAGLLREKLWAYPASLAVLGGFIAYQLYRYSYGHSILLLLLTAFDLVVIVLVWHEWRLLERHLKRREQARLG